MIRENLSGKRIAITGSTGFLGTALVERFLRSVPDCELVLLVRPGRRGAEHRVKRDILSRTTPSTDSVMRSRRTPSQLAVWTARPSTRCATVECSQ